MKNKIQKIAFISLISLFSSGLLKAQTNDVKVFDFSIIPRYSFNMTTDSVELAVSFKISKPKDVLNANLWLGTMRDDLTVYSIQPTFNTVDNTTTMVCNNTSHVLTGYQISFLVKLSKAQYSSFKTATLYAEKINGETTPRVYCEK